MSKQGATSKSDLGLVHFDDIHAGATPELDKSLCDFMRAVCDIMKGADDAKPDCWTWGRCVVGDLSHAEALSFLYGGDDDHPADGRGDFAVLYARGIG